MTRCRKKTKHYHNLSSKIFVWSHAEKAEIDYFQDFKNHLRTHQLVPKKKVLGSPQELIDHIINWRIKENKISKEDGDQVWCVFDVDDFYSHNPQSLLSSIKKAKKNNIKIAFSNECFELWILLHFKTVSAPVFRNNLCRDINKLFKKNKLKDFKSKNQKVFDELLPFQEMAIKNSKKLLSVKYNKIKWEWFLSEKGNPSTTVHLLVQEINNLIK